MTQTSIARIVSLTLAASCFDTAGANESSNNNPIIYSFIARNNTCAFVSPSQHNKYSTAIRQTHASSSFFYADSADEGETSSNKNQQQENPPQDKNKVIMKAWTCHGRNQRDLVDRMMQAKIVRTDSVRDVLYQVDRQHYAPAEQQEDKRMLAYMDTPQPIGLGQTISAPHMHAYVLEEMYPCLKASKSSQVKILDVGCGSGYLTAALGRWVAPLLQQTPPADGDHQQQGSSGSLLDDNKTGRVYGIDVYPHLVNLTKQNMEKADGDLLDNSIVSLKVSDGWKGLPEASPFDVIHVGAAASEFPRPLLEQLKVGGVLIIPVGPDGGVQNLYKVERLSEDHGFVQEDFKITELLGVRYVPLIQQP